MLIQSIRIVDLSQSTFRHFSIEERRLSIEERRLSREIVRLSIEERRSFRVAHSPARICVPLFDGTTVVQLNTDIGEDRTPMIYM